MSEVVYSGTVSALLPLIQTFPADGDTLMILEEVPDHWIEVAPHQPDSGLKFVRFDDRENFEGWGRGRIFNQTAELRWEKNEAGFQVVYIGPPVTLPGLTSDDTLNLAQMEQKETGYYLWGQRMSQKQLQDIGWENPADTDIFIELQTPRVLRYPVQDQPGNRLKLNVIEYYSPQTGQLALYRMKGVETA
ncbi:MAG: hypothetical protein D6706_09910 [Chloroflexi bacterium]|nr:MAG: hypothetical protein D6706_09910 [Chloroflexota bacterium]